ncbi:DMT family transporter [Photobacterium sp. SP02]|uniref:DMT family transporter n=1 Tax=Photobacterium sp. SP02 TaxID=3032280 RepID=UPI00314508AE
MLNKGRHLGVLLAAFSFLMFSVMDALGKQLSSDYSFAQITFFSSVFSLIPIIFMLNGNSFSSVLVTTQYRYHLARGSIILAMRFSALFAFSQMDFADTFSIILTGPLLLCLLSPVFLAERISVYQLLCVCLGFAGTIVVLRPGMVTFNLGVLGALAAALCFALNTIVMRKMGPKESPAAVLFYGMLFNILASGLLLTNSFTVPTWSDLGLFILCGLSAGLAQLCIFLALKRVSASVTGMMQYTCIVWAGVIGYIVWDDIPDNFVLLGSLLIVISGLMNIRHATRQVA